MDVLIADDEPQMVKILSTYFKKEGFNVLTANDGQEALDIFESTKIELAILDWMMPKIDGIEVCKYIKDNSQTKVLILTAKGQTEDEIKALHNGADEYIKKPFDPQILLLRAKKLMNNSEEIKVRDIRIMEHEKKHTSTKNYYSLPRLNMICCCFSVEIKVLFYRGTGWLIAFGAWIMMVIFEQSIRISGD